MTPVTETLYRSLLSFASLLQNNVNQLVSFQVFTQHNYQVGQVLENFKHSFFFCGITLIRCLPLYTVFTSKLMHNCSFHITQEKRVFFLPGPKCFLVCLFVCLFFCLLDCLLVFLFVLQSVSYTACHVVKRPFMISERKLLVRWICQSQRLNSPYFVCTDQHHFQLMSQLFLLSPPHRPCGYRTAIYKNFEVLTTTLVLLIYKQIFTSLVLASSSLGPCHAPVGFFLGRAFNIKHSYWLRMGHLS